MTPKGHLFMNTCLFGALAACDRPGTGLQETSQEIQTIDGVPTVASNDPMYLACIEEAKKDIDQGKEVLTEVGANQDDGAPAEDEPTMDSLVERFENLKVDPVRGKNGPP